VTTDTESKRSRIKEKIAASQARLRGDANAVPPPRPNFPDAHPPENYRSLAGEYPWLTVAAGLGAGLLVGALLPKKAGSKLGKRAIGLATVAGELALVISKRAGDAAQDNAARLTNRLDDSTMELRGKARRTAGRAVGSARSAGQVVVREALKLANRARN
jgi:ElaB/YqjD/DUF883 family membrane-anchored ribosome-binding protein